MIPKPIARVSRAALGEARTLVQLDADPSMVSPQPFNQSLTGFLRARAMQ